LRHSCLLTQQQTAEYLGVCLRTVRHWDAGRNRVPWSAVRLLRLLRAGDLGGLLEGWEGWRIVRDRLVSPEGRVYCERDMRHWWLTIEQAHLFRAGYDAATKPEKSGAVHISTGRPCPLPTGKDGRGVCGQANAAPFPDAAAPEAAPDVLTVPERGADGTPPRRAAAGRPGACQ
jgi:hypothetical protein